MHTNTAMSPGYTPRENIKQHTSIRAKLGELQADLIRLEDSGQADSERARELRYALTLLGDLLEAEGR